MIKVIIFDADGVVIYKKIRFSETLAQKHGISIETTLPFFSGPFQECLIGYADLRETIVPYLNEWGWDKGIDTLLEYWFSLENETDKEIIEYIKVLRHKGILCFLATNNEKYRFQYMLDEMDLKNVFDKTYASAHLGNKKPNLEFFHKIFKELKNIKKEEILLVDDSSENIKGAKEFGINTEFYTSLENLKKKIYFLNQK
jgi:putative hydrolase of the HAD superfamily